MNLKNAFRFQNKLEHLMDETSGILQDQRNISKVKASHLHSQISAEEKDVWVKDAQPSDYTDQTTVLATFLMAMLTKREKPANAIHDTKSKLDIDMDNQGGLNRTHQQLSDSASTAKSSLSPRTGGLNTAPQNAGAPITPK